MKIFCALLVWFLLADAYLAQQPLLRLATVTGKLNDSVTVDLRAENLADIGAMTLKINIDTAALSWGRALNWDSQLDGPLTGVVNGQIVLAWDGLSGVNISSGILVSLKFLYKGKIGSISFDTANSELANTASQTVKPVYINGSVSPLTAVDHDPRQNPPLEYGISQNYPNPFNPSTTIKYVLPFESRVIVLVHNVLGQVIMKFDDGIKTAGNYTISFNGEGLSSGVYFYNINLVSVDGKQEFHSVKKMILAK